MLAIGLWIGLFVAIAGSLVIFLGMTTSTKTARAELFGCGGVIAAAGLLISAVSLAVHYIVRALP